MGEEKQGGRVKVVDRRSFTPEGEPREIPPPATVQPSPTPPAPQPPSQPEPPPPEPVGATEPPSPGQLGFLDLVDFLAQQATVLLSGKVPGRGADPETARYFIELLAVLREKTHGQLSTQEQAILDDVLYQLRSLYVATTR